MSFGMGAYTDVYMRLSGLYKFYMVYTKLCMVSVTFTGNDPGVVIVVVCQVLYGTIESVATSFSCYLRSTVGAFRRCHSVESGGLWRS